MAHLCYLLTKILFIYLFITPTLQSVRYGFPPDTLHVNNDDEIVSKGRIIDNENALHEFIRSKRSAQPVDDTVAASKSSSSIKSSDETNLRTMVCHIHTLACTRID